MSSTEIKTTSNHSTNKIDNLDYTGFAVHKNIGDATVEKLDKDGRITVLTYPTIGFPLYNVYFTTGAFDMQLKEAKILKKGLETCIRQQKDPVLLGDFNSVVDFSKDVVTVGKSSARKPAGKELDLMKFLQRMFQHFGMYDIFRELNPDKNEPINFPFNHNHCQRRLDRIYVTRIKLTSFTYKILAENKQISTHDMISLIDSKCIDSLPSDSDPLRIYV